MTPATMNSAAAALETVTRTAALGVRFWDRVSGRAVADGLQLIEVRSGRAAIAGPSNVFVFHDLPGLRADTFGSGEDTFWASPPIAAPLTFELTDHSRRFLPFRFAATLPVRGLFTPDCTLVASPPNAVPGSVPLFSASSRSAPPAFAVVRAELWDALADAPAANAILEVSGVGPTLGSAPWQGLADADGRAVVLCPYPEPRWPGSSPPPGSSSLSDQTWSVTVTVRYGAWAASPPLAAAGSPEPPDLCAVLAQPAATLLAALSPATAIGPQALVFGRELVLRSAGQSVLLVTPI